MPNTQHFCQLFSALKIQNPNSTFLFVYKDHFYSFGEDAHHIARLMKLNLCYNENLPETIQACAYFPLPHLTHYYPLLHIELNRIIIKNPVLGTEAEDRELYEALEKSLIRRAS